MYYTESNKLLIKVLYIVRRDDLGKIFWNLRKRPIVLLILLVILFIWSEKFNFISNVKPRCFWNKLLLNGILLNKRVGWGNFLIFLLNITYCACLLKAGSKIIFHWKAQLLIAFRSWLKVVALVWMLFTTEKMEVSWAKSLQFEERSLGKSFMQIRNNKGSKMEPCGTPALTLS